MTDDTSWEQGQPKPARARLVLLVALALVAGLAVARGGGVAPDPDDLVVEESSEEAAPPAVPENEPFEPPVPGRVWSIPGGGPLEQRAGAVTVWTGEHVLVWGGVGERPYSDGALYDPARGTWQQVSPSGLQPRSGAAAVWTGKEVIVMGGSVYQPATPFPVVSREAADGAAYDPETDTWRPMPPMPFATSGNRLFAAGAKVYAVSRRPRERPLAVLDGGSGIWRLAAAPPHLSRDQPLQAAASGGALWLWGSGGGTTVELNLAAERWGVPRGALRRASGSTVGVPQTP